MDSYEIWVNLVPGVKDLDFVDSLDAYLGSLQNDGLIASFRVRRRKFGFGPEALGEWNISIECENLSQLESAFQRVAVRDKPMEDLHSQVFSKVCDYKSGLYRDFPDPVRQR